MRRSVIAGAVAALLAASPPAVAAEPVLSAEPWPHAVACTALLFHVVENVKAKGVETAGGEAGLQLLEASRDAWFNQATTLPEFGMERMEADMLAYIAGPIGSGPEALSNDVRLANIEVCVNEAIAFEAEREKTATPE